MSFFDSRTTRMPNGVTNAGPWQTMGAAGIPDPTWAHVYANDFDTYNAGDWTITKTGTGTEALEAFDGGALLVSNTSGVADATYMQLVNASFKLLPGKNAFFKWNGQLSDVTNDVFYVGLVQAGATTVASITDGIFIEKASGAASLTLNAAVGGVVTSVALPTSLVPVAATTFELGMSVDMYGNLAAYFNPTTGPNEPSAAQVAATLPIGRVAALYAAYLPGNPGTAISLTQALLSPSMGFLNTTAAARTMTVDYIVAVRER